MFEREATLLRFARGYYDALTDDLTDAQLIDQPMEGVKPPIWVLGHLAVVNDFTLRMLGRPGVCPAEWHKGFGPGSANLGMAGAGLTKADLVGAFGRGCDAILDALPSADPDAMAAPQALPFRLLKEHLPTVGDLVANLCSSHIALHLGQLSTWRRIRGLPEVIV